jgi:hypothetical protein
MKSCAPFIYSLIVDERAADRLVTKVTPEGTLSYSYYPSGQVARSSALKNDDKL